MTSGWDFVQALSVLRSPARSYVTSTNINPPVACGGGNDPVSMWKFDSIRSALHSEVRKWATVKEGPDEGDLNPPSKQTTPRRALPFIPSQLGIIDVTEEEEEEAEDETSSLSLVSTTNTTPILGPQVEVATGLGPAEAQRANLMLKLMSNFPEYAKRLDQQKNPGDSVWYMEQRKIHVFVDISNILIGFHELAKEIRGIHPHTRVPRIPFSFTNFSLILERGRISAKKVLAGSDRHAAIYEAESLGYETNILQRVLKNKPTKSVHYRPLENDFQENHDGNSSSNSMGDNTERWMEQGVDEILHLKMLESMVDAEIPGTIVLATGDAAKAEYSDGFLSMVERALQRGWNVELVSFSHLTSWAYKKKEFRKEWGARFQIIDLDTYVEELFRLKSQGRYP